MSKQYLTITQAMNKIGASGTGTNFITKAQCISMGGNKINTSKLTGYDNADYVVDDDIVAAQVATSFTYTLGNITVDLSLYNPPSNLQMNTYPPTVDAYLYIIYSNGTSSVGNSVTASLTTNSTNQLTYTVSNVSINVYTSRTISYMYLVLISATDSFMLLDNRTIPYGYCMHNDTISISGQISNITDNTWANQSPLIRGDYGEDPVAVDWIIPFSIKGAYRSLPSQSHTSDPGCTIVCTYITNEILKFRSLLDLRIESTSSNSLVNDIVSSYKCTIQASGKAGNQNIIKSTNALTINRIGAADANFYLPGDLEITTLTITLNFSSGIIGATTNITLSSPSDIFGDVNFEQSYSVALTDNTVFTIDLSDTPLRVVPISQVSSRPLTIRIAFT